MLIDHIISEAFAPPYAINSKFWGSQNLYMDFFTHGAGRDGQHP